jgi:hypothetical protein
MDAHRASRQPRPGRFDRAAPNSRSYHKQLVWRYQLGFSGPGIANQLAVANDHAARARQVWRGCHKPRVGKRAATGKIALHGTSRATAWAGQPVRHSGLLLAPGY